MCIKMTYNEIEQLEKQRKKRAIRWMLLISLSITALPLLLNFHSYLHGANKQKALESLQFDAVKYLVIFPVIYIAFVIGENKDRGSRFCLRCNIGSGNNFKCFECGENTEFLCDYKWLEEPNQSLKGRM